MTTFTEALSALLAEAETHKAEMLARLTAMKAERDELQQSGAITLRDLETRNAEITALSEEYGRLYWLTHPNPKKRALAFGPPAAEG